MHVRPTKDLWNRIEHKIDAMFEKRLAYAMNVANYGMTMQDFDAKCIASVIPREDQELFDRLGDKYLNTYTSISIKVETSFGSYGHEAEFPKRTYQPDKLHHYSARLTVTDPEIIELVERRNKQVAFVKKEKEQFIQKAKEAFDNCASINQLAKLWPPIIDLLPHDIIERMNKKVERKTIANVAKLVNQELLSDLSGHLLKAKVAK